MDPRCDVASIQSNLEHLNLNPTLTNLPDEVLHTILLYTGPKDIDGSAKFVCQTLHNATSLSKQLWRQFCIFTGKTLAKKYATADKNECGDNAFRQMTTFSGGDEKETDQIEKENAFRSYYFRNPCVPVDFDTVTSALEHCSRTKMSILEDDNEFHYSDIGTVCLMPGVYKEKIVIKGEVWGVGSTSIDNKAVAIRASFPTQGATIAHYTDDNDAKNQPCISVSTRDGAETLEGAQKGITVNLSHLSLLHSSAGCDLWEGNAAVVVNGARATVIINSCVIQSHSGRGIVATNQAELQMHSSSVVDCAATGLYLGDWGSRANVSGCNFVRNGFGSRKALSSDQGRQELQNVLTEWTRLRARAADANGDVVSATEDFDLVPPGHSGLFIEGAMCWIENTLIAANCLTGTSVIRNGFLSLSGCDILQNTGNGHPISIEDEEDVGNNRLQGARIRGGVIERHNDYSNSQKYQAKLRDGASFACDLVAPMSEEELVNILDTAV